MVATKCCHCPHKYGERKDRTLCIFNLYEEKEIPQDIIFVGIPDFCELDDIPDEAIIRPELYLGDI